MGGGGGVRGAVGSLFSSSYRPMKMQQQDQSEGIHGTDVHQPEKSVADERCDRACRGDDVAEVTTKTAKALRAKGRLSATATDP
eukprot:scaffold22309_cov116-Isochrysis_galbana.AAC.8